MARLTTTRYVRPGVYIGNLITPKPGNLTADARTCNYVGRGSKFAVASNMGILRSFVYAESLVLPKSAPFVHVLAYPADGVKDAPARLYDAKTGVELLPSDWNFLKDGADYARVIINPDKYDATAEYKIDYQSTSAEVQDPLPVSGLRFIKALGRNQNRAQYQDLKNFFIPFTFSGPFTAAGNFVDENFITGVTADVNNFSSGGSLATQGDYTHAYNRFYVLECTDAGLTPPYTATFKWVATRYSGGRFSEPPTPLHSSIAAPTFTADASDSTSLTQDLEFGIQVNIEFGPQNFAVGDRFYFNAVGAAKMEFNSRYYNTNQYVQCSNILATPVVGSTGSLSYDASNGFIGNFNTKFKLQCVSRSGSSPNRVATFAYAAYGDLVGSSGSVTVTEGGSAAVLPHGVRLAASFGSLNFAVGDVFEFECKAPRMFYQAKDDRNIRLEVSSVVIPGADESVVNMSYSTGTAEGGFGEITAEMNLLSGVNGRNGEIVLPDNVSVMVRNMIRGNINEASYRSGDKFEAAITSREVIDWGLSSTAEEIREVTGFLTDVTGSSTGSVGSCYITVSNTYKAGSVVVVDAETSAAVASYEIPGTRFVGLVSKPSKSIRVSYEYRGDEPAPGQLYYLTAYYKRPDEAYNKPVLILEKAEGQRYLAPAAVDNHLYIMNELAFANNAPGIYVTQVKDADGDGVFTEVDVKDALDAHEGVSRITDLCVLSFFGNLGDALAANEKGNDPFEKREQLLWVGAPIGTPIGDIDTENSLVFLARRTMQVAPQSPAQGTRILVAPTECRVDLRLDNNVVVNVRLDGSFVAGATSALVNSFADPAETILRKNLSGFTYVQTYSEPQDEILGQASITYLSDQGSGVYRFEEDITVHTIADEFQNINVTVQKHFVTKVVRREMDNALIALVPPSLEAGIAVIRSTLANILLTLVGRGLVAPYRDDSGRNRGLDAEKDIKIYKDESSETLFYFAYTFFVKSAIKRLQGLYQVNQSNLSI